MKEYKTASPEGTEALGEALARALFSASARRALIAYRGELGVGKTAFTRGFCRIAAPRAAVKSPTYTVVNEYRSGPLPIFHFDMYRIEDEDELYSIGYTDYTEKDGYILIEWSENISSALPSDAITVEILRGERESDRTVRIEGGAYEDLMP